MNSIQSHVTFVGQVAEVTVNGQTLTIRVESFFGVAYLPKVRYASVHCVDASGNKVGRRFSVQGA